ncbi:MAG: serine hydrolase [Candidatus Promineifilaceae bacterium]
MTNLKQTRFSLLIFVLLLMAGCSAGSAVPNPPDYWPTGGWQTSSPEQQGVDSQTLVEMYRAIDRQAINLHSLIIIRNGYIISEAYFHPYTAENQHDIASVTKSVTATLLGIAVEQNIIKDIDQRVLSFYPDRYVENRDSRKEALALKHLLTLETGFECDLALTEMEMQQSGNWAAYLLNLPMANKPGKEWYYCSPATHLISVILEKSTGMHTREFANANLFKPLGIPEVQPAQWPSDPQGTSRGDIGLNLTPRDMAKLGLLYLQDGVWNGTRLLPEGWVSAASAEQADKGDGTSYGYLWTTYPHQSHYAALGMGAQQLHIFPEQNIIVVVTAALPVYAESEEINSLLNDYILPAAISDTPLPENPEAANHLTALQTAVSNPDPKPTSLPDIAYLISGKTYLFDENPMGWHSLRITFTKGSTVASALMVQSVENPEFEIGLDGRFRVTELPGATPIALKADWIDNSTLLVRQLNLGTIQEYNLTLSFHDYGLQARLLDTVFGTIDVEANASAVSK